MSAEPRVLLEFHHREFGDLRLAERDGARIVQYKAEYSGEWFDSGRTDIPDAAWPVFDAMRAREVQE